MDSKQTQLDPKLKEVYDRVMSTSAVPKTSAKTNTPSSPTPAVVPPPVEPTPTSPSVQMQTVEVPDAPLPPTLSSAPVPETNTMQATVAATIPAAGPTFAAPSVVPGTSGGKNKEKKLPGFLSIFIFFILIVFFLVYSFFWVKFFNLNVPI